MMMADKSEVRIRVLQSSIYFQSMIGPERMLHASMLSAFFLFECDWAVHCDL